ncbi:hypothetical protein SNE40_004101 [Patella caerulea]|uniref:Uncharacterized protein n=1 Tax=Patella caerulea TaxID=87958 RepID=A0AAN8K9C2_PATCE
MEGDEASCTEATSTCLLSNVIVESATTCSEREPYFKCLRDKGCQVGFSSYDEEVVSRNYSNCFNGEFLL